MFSFKAIVLSWSKYQQSTSSSTLYWYSGNSRYFRNAKVKLELFVAAGSSGRMAVILGLKCPKLVAAQRFTLRLDY
jgi:hypothetical protein